MEKKFGLSVWLWLVWLRAASEAAVLPDPHVPDDLSRANHAEVGSPLRLAQCRAKCLLKFANGKEDTCLQDPDCYMCWKNCELLQTNYAVWGSMCSDKRICYPGCQEACRFHLETSQKQQAQPVILTRGEEVLTLSTLPLGAGVVRWPASPKRNAVYVLMARPTGASSWRQISQSTETEARIEAGNPVFFPGTILRVLVVDPEGLVTIFSPAPQPTPSLILSTLAPQKQQHVSSTALPQVDEASNEELEPWRLEEVSLLHQRILVIAEVAWTPRARRGVYLVTWEVDGGGLKGNLFTDSTSVTLSLWPDTIYHIQVELVSRIGEERAATGRVERSEVLMIDTRKAAQVESAVATAPGAPSAEPWEHLAKEAARRSRRQLTEEMLAGTGAAMLLFLTLAMAWRCHQARRQAISKRRLLLADDSISAAGRSSPVLSVMRPQDCCDPAALKDRDFLTFPPPTLKV